MDIEQVRDYALSLHGTTEDMPYGPDCVVFRIEGKIFLHISLESSEPRCAVKLDPALGVELRERENGICPAYHMNRFIGTIYILKSLMTIWLRNLLIIRIVWFCKNYQSG